MATLKRAIYLLLTFPLGAVWFAILITALASAVGLAVTLLGFPILAGTLYLIRPMAQLERRLIRRLLGVDIPGRYRAPDREGRWPAVQARLADAQTYKDLAYLLVQLPVGIVWTALVLADAGLLLAALALALLLSPLWRWRPLAGVRAPLLAAWATLRAIDCKARAHAAWARMALEASVDPELAEARSTQLRIVEAADAERRRLERDLHDGAQQRLVALSLKLGMARARLDGTGGDVAALVAEAHDESKLALGELRDLARGIHPAVLTERGLSAALQDLAARSPVPVTVEAAPDERLPAAVEATAYFCVAECLANVAKYAHASAAWVAVRREPDALAVEVRDDGAGGADPAAGSGLRGLTDRVGALDGRLTVDSPPGRGTTVRAVVPLTTRAGSA
ncbi:MAG TPA: sensor domain-containing protein [Solirubrobacteraceae bacterium]